jgi:hypothetical protein
MGEKEGERERERKEEKNMEIPIYMTIQKTSINHNQSNIFSLASLHVLQHKKFHG